MRTPIIFFFLALVTQTLLAQEPNSWLIYFGQLQLKQSKFSIHHELQIRDYKILRDHNQTLARVGVQYQIKPFLQTTFGYAYVHTELEGTPNKPFGENRIYQEILLSHKLSQISLRQRFRLEERFIENRDFLGRLRYTLFADIPLTAAGMSKGGVYAALYDEIFLNLSNDDRISAYDRNRAYAGAGYKLNDHFGVQLGYLRQNVGKLKGTNHVLLSMHKKIFWK